MANLLLNNAPQSIPDSKQGCVFNGTNSFYYGYGNTEPTDWLFGNANTEMHYDGKNGLLWAKVVSSSDTTELIYFVGGTSPSFTRAITRNVLPFIPAEPQKRIMNRSIVLTTLNSVTPVLFAGAANNIQLVINLGTATTPPALQLEGSEDGINWYAIGTPLTGVASSTVQVTIANVSATFVRARVSTIGAAVVAGYVSIKAWS